MATATRTTVPTATPTDVLGNTVALPAKAEAAIRDWILAKAAKKHWEDKADELKLELREMLGEAEVGTIRGTPRLKVSTRSRTDIDRALLQEAWPEAFEMCSVVSEYEVLNTA